MARGGGRSSGGGKRVSSGRFGAGRDPSSIVRDSRGRFAYTGGRKKPPRRLRRRRGTVDSTAVSNAATALSKAESKSVSRKQLEALKKSVGGVRPKRKVVTGSNVDKAKQVLGGLESKTVSKKQLEAIAKQVGGLQPVKVVTAAGNPESRGIATIRSSALGVKDRVKRKQATPVAQPDNPKATVKPTAPKATAPKPKEPQATQPKQTVSTKATQPVQGTTGPTGAAKGNPDKFKAPATTPATSQPTGSPKFPLKADGSIRKPPSIRENAKAEHLQIGDDGKIKIWDGSKHDIRKHRGYREGKDDFEYAPIDPNGKRKVIPPNGNVKALFEGEQVHGMPKHPDFKQMSDKALVNALADRMARVETGDKGGVSAGAPKVNGDRFEIHHVDQWAKRNFREITLDLQAGKITLEDAKAEMKKLVYPSDDSPEGYRIIPQAKGERRLVVLRGKDHVGASFELNHPKGVHPDTGELVTFGIPKTGDSGREWFNGWRDRFWNNYNRVEAYQAAKELERRIKRGGLTPEEARRLWGETLSSQAKTNEYQKQWRDAFKQESAAKKAQKEAEKQARAAARAAKAAGT